LLGLIRDGKDPATAGETKRRPRRTWPLRLALPDGVGATAQEAAHRSTKIREIGKADVARLHAAMQATPVAANRALALLSAMLGWAEKVGERPDSSNPCRHIERYPEKPVERLLTAAELNQLGQALDRAAQPWTDASRAAGREECERQVEAMETPLAERAGWIKARIPRASRPRTGAPSPRFDC
jgi:hypothetical protein